VKLLPAGKFGCVSSDNRGLRGHETAFSELDGYLQTSYLPVDQFEGWGRFPGFIESVIQQYGATRVAEIGAGANPAIGAEFARAHRLEYLALDEDENEIRKANGARMALFDICRSSSTIPGAPYHLIFGRMTAEHFRDADAAYGNMIRSLAPGGIVVQSFACLYSLPFLVNRLTPERVAAPLLSWVAPRDGLRHDKFKAFYRRCCGPSRTQLRFFQRTGFEVLAYRAYFGHHYYQHRLWPLDRIEQLKAQLLMRLQIPHLASYATVVLRRPD